MSAPEPAKIEAPPPKPVAPAEPPAPFAWPEIPDLDKVAIGPMHGVAAGVPFDIGAVVIVHTSDGWEVQMTSSTNPHQSARFDLPKGTPKKGKKLTFKTEYGEHAGITVAKADEPGKLTGLGAPNSWALELTELTLGTKAKPGHASGRLAIAFKASEPIAGMSSYRASWIVGTFTDAPVQP